MPNTHTIPRPSLLRPAPPVGTAARAKEVEVEVEVEVEAQDRCADRRVAHAVYCQLRREGPCVVSASVDILPCLPGALETGEDQTMVW